MLDYENLRITAGFEPKKNSEIIDNKKISNEEFYYTNMIKDFEGVDLINFSIDVLSESLFNMGLAFNAIEQLKKYNSNESFEFINKYNFDMEGVLSSIGEGIKKVWEFVKNVFKKIFSAIASFFKWIASFFKKSKNENVELDTSKKKNIIQKAKEFFKRKSSGENMSIESNQNERSLNTISMKGYNEHQIFAGNKMINPNKDFIDETYFRKGCEEILKGLKRVQGDIVVLKNEIDRFTNMKKISDSDFRFKFQGLIFDGEAGKMNLEETIPSTNEMFYGSEKPKIYRYNVITVLEQIPSRLISTSFDNIIIVYIQRFQKFNKTINETFRNFEKTMEKGLIGFSYEEYVTKTQAKFAINLTRILARKLSKLSKLMVTSLKEMTYIQRKGRDAYFKLDRLTRPIQFS